jgi:hypothetical protein
MARHQGSSASAGGFVEPFVRYCEVITGGRVYFMSHNLLAVRLLLRQTAVGFRSFEPLTAKNPAIMKPGTFAVNTFRMEGNDTLSLTKKAAEAGPVTNPATRKLTRLE